VSFRLPHEQDIDSLIDEAAIEKLTYDLQFKLYRIRLNAAPDDKQLQTLIAMAKRSRAGFGKPT
jgi:hypothetical protein